MKWKLTRIAILNRKSFANKRISPNDISTLSRCSAPLSYLYCEFAVYFSLAIFSCYLFMQYFFFSVFFLLLLIGEFLVPLESSKIRYAVDLSYCLSVLFASASVLSVNMEKPINSRSGCIPIRVVGIR